MKLSLPQFPLYPQVNTQVSGCLCSKGLPGHSNTHLQWRRHFQKVIRLPMLLEI